MDSTNNMVRDEIKFQYIIECYGLVGVGFNDFPFTWP